MCLLCEDADLYTRYRILQQIADGKMPEGFTEDDLRGMGMPLPGEVEVVVEADGTRTLVEKPGIQKSSNFTCDSPE
ncbi:MAG: hypothetical protein AB7K35_00385 [Pseudorhodoplanes sp.]